MLKFSGLDQLWKMGYWLLKFSLRTYLRLLLIGDDKLGFEQIIIVIIFNTYTLKESLTVIGWSFASEYCLPWFPKI